jgi:hypothetical protein
MHPSPFEEVQRLRQVKRQRSEIQITFLDIRVVALDAVLFEKGTTSLSRMSIEQQSLSQGKQR